MDPELNRIDPFLRDTAKHLDIDLTSWKIITDFQILKKKDQFHVNTVQCIQVMDTKFNWQTHLDTLVPWYLGTLVPWYLGTLAHVEMAEAVAPDQYSS